MLAACTCHVVDTCCLATGTGDNAQHPRQHGPLCYSALFPHLPTCFPLQMTFFDPVRTTWEYCSRLACPGSMGPPLCLAQLQRDGGVGVPPPRLVWGDTGAWEGRGEKS